MGHVEWFDGVVTVVRFARETVLAPLVRAKVATIPARSEMESSRDAHICKAVCAHPRLTFRRSSSLMLSQVGLTHRRM